MQRLPDSIRESNRKSPRCDLDPLPPRRPGASCHFCYILLMVASYRAEESYVAIAIVTSRTLLT